LRLSGKKNMLIIRFSAMGDVVLTVPVIQSLLQKYPETQITLLTNSFFHPFFEGIPNLTLYPVDLKGKHKGILGLWKLVKELVLFRSFDVVIDLHSVIRTWIIVFFLKQESSISIFRINKGRKDKKIFIKKKSSQTLPHTTERYQAVFKKAGFDFELEKGLLQISGNAKENIKPYTDSKIISIGIAPFAAHKSKQWGIEKIHGLIQEINQKYKVQFYLFGGGKKEVTQLDEIASTYENVNNMAGKFTLQEELALLKNLKVLIAMDSGNMHIASLLDIPVLSIWGGTHPDIGFSAMYQPKENSIQIAIDELPCRPCSVFGTNDCKLSDNPFACMNQISPKVVIERLENLNILH